MNTESEVSIPSINQLTFIGNESIFEIEQLIQNAEEKPDLKATYNFLESVAKIPLNYQQKFSEHLLKQFEQNYEPNKEKNTKNKNWFKKHILNLQKTFKIFNKKNEQPLNKDQLLKFQNEILKLTKLLYSYDVWKLKQIKKKYNINLKELNG